MFTLQDVEQNCASQEYRKLQIFAKDKSLGAQGKRTVLCERIANYIKSQQALPDIASDRPKQISKSIDELFSDRSKSQDGLALTSLKTCTEYKKQDLESLAWDKPDHLGFRTKSDVKKAKKQELCDKLFHLIKTKTIPESKPVVAKLDIDLPSKQSLVNCGSDLTVIVLKNLSKKLGIKQGKLKRELCNNLLSVYETDKPVDEIVLTTIDEKPVKEKSKSDDVYILKDMSLFPTPYSLAVKTARNISNFQTYFDLKKMFLQTCKSEAKNQQTEDDISNAFKTFKLYRTEQFFQKAFCAFQTLVETFAKDKCQGDNLSIPYGNSLMDKVFKNVVLLSEGGYGKAFISSIFTANKAVVIKESLSPEFAENFHEMTVGMMLNTIGLPYYVKTFGGFLCTKSLKTCFKSTESLKMGGFFVVTEYIKGVTLYDSFSNLSFNSLVSLLFIICYALQQAQDKYKFTHNDLHSLNILLIDQPCSVTWLGKTVKSNYTPVIIDFGNSTFVYNNKVVFAHKIDKDEPLEFSSADPFLGSFDMFRCIYSLFTVNINSLSPNQQQTKLLLSLLGLYMNLGGLVKKDLDKVISIHRNYHQLLEVSTSKKASKINVVPYPKYLEYENDDPQKIAAFSSFKNLSNVEVGKAIINFL